MAKQSLFIEQYLEQLKKTLKTITDVAWPRFQQRLDLQKAEKRRELHAIASNLVGACYEPLVLESAEKYLWMMSAWMMTEVFRGTRIIDEGEEEDLPLPPQAIWIEFEQPQHTPRGQTAVVTFFPCHDTMLLTEAVRHFPTKVAAWQEIFQQVHEELQRPHWKLQVVHPDPEQPDLWTIHYLYDPQTKRGRWSLPINYTCPHQACRREHVPPATIRFLLCEPCQYALNYYCSWIETALKMIAGYFQEAEEVSTPETITETVKRRIEDATRTWKARKVSVTHHYQVIRYLDACVSKAPAPPQKLRGSWMSERPVTQDEYDINPNAIIFVPIQPREYHRTYRHERYKNVRGQTQHITPGMRRQPMTVASLQQRKSSRVITQVLASKFPSAAPDNGG